jgi:selenocysteine lyase/cysteine desulfurase
MAGAAGSTDSIRAELRRQMPVAEKWAYFDHAAVAPLCKPAAEGLAKWLDQALREGDVPWLEWARQVASARSLAARLIAADETEIALVPNTTAGINFVAEGLDWRKGDNVVTLDDEFPSNLYPWLNLAGQGVETRRVPTHDGHVELDQLAAHCDDRTRVVSVSWVGYANGCRRNLSAIAEIAHRRDAIFFVDAIQGLGVFPLDVKQCGVDCLSADGHKWLLGPEGAGVAYVSRECLDRLRPIGVGWGSVVHASDFDHIELDLKPTAARYEGGSHNMAGFVALAASLELLVSLGTEHLAAAILETTNEICRRAAELGVTVCSPRSATSSSGIVSLEIPGANSKLFRQHFLGQGVVVNCRHGRLRLSAHAYHDDGDLERLFAALESLVG